MPWPPPPGGEGEQPRSAPATTREASGPGRGYRASVLDHELGRSSKSSITLDWRWSKRDPPDQPESREFLRISDEGEMLKFDPRMLGTSRSLSKPDVMSGDETGGARWWACPFQRPRERLLFSRLSAAPDVNKLG